MCFFYTKCYNIFLPISRDRSPSRIVIRWAGLLKIEKTVRDGQENLFASVAYKQEEKSFPISFD